MFHKVKHSCKNMAKVLKNKKDYRNTNKPLLFFFPFYSCEHEKNALY